jgi:hypothetical protein
MATKYMQRGSFNIRTLSRRLPSLFQGAVVAWQKTQRIG